MFVLSQICAIISTILLGFSYFAKDKKNVMLFCVFYCIFYGIHYLLLGAFTGLAMNLVSLFRNIWFYFTAKKKNNNSLFSLVLFVVFSLIGVVITYNSLFSVILMVGNVLSTYSVWQSDVFRYRVLAIFVSVCFLIYAVSVGSLFAIVTEAFLFILEVISVIKYRRDDLF